MVFKLYFLALVAVYSFIPDVNGEECVAGAVLNLRINTEAILSWEVNPIEACPIEGFQVDIIGNRDDEFHFKVTENQVDLSFMEICEEWHFTVTPVSDGVLGYGRRLTHSIPLPSSADISIRYFTIQQINPRDIYLQWGLNNYTLGDCNLRYRITIEDEDMGDIHDIYVTGRSIHLHNLSPCVSYNLGIRAINRVDPIIEGPLMQRLVEIPPLPEDAPRLRSIEVGTTSVDMTWRLENAGRNRCPIRTLYVDGGTHFNISVPLEDDIDRPPVQVNLRGLRSNSMYLIHVSVQNSGGVSQATPIAVQTKDINPGSN